MKRCSNSIDWQNDRFIFPVYNNNNNHCHANQIRRYQEQSNIITHTISTDLLIVWVWVLATLISSLHRP